ncbi:MAG: RNA ligase family protein, partial [Pseudomonadota bacterium]
MTLLKYPRTRHIEGSRLQAGDIADDKPLAELRGLDLIVEEKLDGANSAVSFGLDGDLRLQSRGHYLTGGGRERHFALLKTWAATHAQAF